MKRTLILVLAFAFSVAASADEKGRISTASLMEKFEASQDTAYLIKAVQRCVALLSVLSQLGVPDIKEEVDALAVMAVAQNKVLSSSRGVKFDQPMIASNIQAEADWYASRMAVNQNSTGDTLTGDEYLISEAQQCRALGGMAVSSRDTNEMLLNLMGDVGNE
jgi:hypothetical protein